MAVEWSMDGPYVKACNCDPGCPCDFNSDPTHRWCAGIWGMRIERGDFGGVDLAGLHWFGVARWPGPLHEGNGEVQYVLDAAADDVQRGALVDALSGAYGDTLNEIISFVCPRQSEPVFVPVEYDWDSAARTARIRAGDVIEADVETLRGIDPPEPYRVGVRIPGGFEYTSDDESAEIARATRIVTRGAIPLELDDGHASLCYARRGSSLERAYRPTVVSG